MPPTRNRMKFIQRKRRPNDRVSGYIADYEDCLDDESAYFSDDTFSGDPCINILELDRNDPHVKSSCRGSILGRLSSPQISSYIDLSNVKVLDASSVVVATTGSAASAVTSNASSSTERDFAAYHSHVADLVDSCAHYYKNPRDECSVDPGINDDDVASVVLKPMPSSSSSANKRRRIIEPIRLSVESIRVAAQVKDFEDDAVIGLSTSARVLIQATKPYNILHLTAGLLQFLTPRRQADQVSPSFSSNHGKVLANFFSAHSFLHLDNVMQSVLHDVKFFGEADYREFNLGNPAVASERRIGSFRRCSLQITPVKKHGSGGNKYFLIQVEDPQKDVDKTVSGTTKKTDRVGRHPPPASNGSKFEPDPAHHTVG
eukprot:CAMPEP_0116026144 /NCGR_PEP_ID=MMETSP0321-20121206/13625_1 /TAXON_ID=163516 /ORGANISM="Leptocylindrus danicus var. danicus, Strain B650" /LENGTH=372 /DNA_ID=CAMNT_0003498785 /DNA_START=61 /DNA_END=1179 /DNA_ORIENTATION=+